MQSALVHLAEATTRAHEVMNTKAAEAGAKVLHNAHVPKDPPAQVIASVLGLG